MPIVKIMSNAVNAYGEENLDAMTAVDALTAAVRLGTLAPDEIAGSLGAAIPLASKMGVSFQEVNAMMAAMSRTGTDAAAGVTQLTAIMSQLLKPTPASCPRMNIAVMRAPDWLAIPTRPAGSASTAMVTEGDALSDTDAKALYGEALPSGLTLRL